ALGPRAFQRLGTRTRLILNENLEAVARWVDGLGGLVSWIAPRAGAIAFLRYQPRVNSTELATRLRKAHDVLVVPGDHFQLDGHIRIGYGGDKRLLEEGLRERGGSADPGNQPDQAAPAALQCADGGRQSLSVRQADERAIPEDPDDAKGAPRRRQLLRSLPVPRTQTGDPHDPHDPQAV